MESALTAAALRDTADANATRLWAALAGADDAAPVPSCPGWTARDLARHVAQVHGLWGLVVADDMDCQTAEKRLAPPPNSLADAVAEGRARTSALVAALGAVEPDAPRWTWHTDRTAGFILRRQAYEALVHRWDAEETADLPADPTPVDVAADGVAECLTVMHDVDGFTDDPTFLVRVAATDTGDTWTVRGGTERQGPSWPEGPALTLLTPGEDRRPDGIVSGAAEDVLRWLWGRQVRGPMAWAGDAAPRALVEAAVRPLPAEAGA